MSESPPVSSEVTPPPPSPRLHLMPLSTGCEDHWSWNKNDKSHEVRLYGPKQRIGNNIQYIKLK